MPDSVRNAIVDSLKKSSDLKAPLNYSAKDSIILDVGIKVLTMYNDGSLSYEKITLQADSIAVDYGNTTLYADGKMDSTGQISGRPVFNEGEAEYKTAKIAYNFKSQKGRIDYARTVQGDQVVTGTAIYKENDSTYYIKDGRFTSCDLDHPHFYIQSKKLKVIPKDKIISGPLRLIIEGFPIPIVVPFGFFPNQTARRSGVIMPTYGEMDKRGYFLRKGGYYFAISDHVDLLVRGDVFSKGGWGLDISSNYNMRYRYYGAIGFEYGRQRYGEKGDPDFKIEKNFFVRWNHDQKFNPSTSLKAMVNAGSTNFLNQNSYSDSDYLTNTLRSNITFNKTFTNTPFSLVANLDHNQNTQTGIVNFTLPNVAFNKSRTFPFKPKHKVSKGAFYEKIGYSYAVNFKNEITIPDSLVGDFFLNPGEDIIVRTITENDSTIDTTYTTREPSEFIRNGIRHTIPITTQMTLLKYINLTPSFNFNEYWYFRTIEKTWQDSVLVTEDVPGFAMARDFNFTANATTRLYGVFDLKGKKQIKLRHTAIPSVGYNFRPDFSDPGWGFYKTVQSDTAGNTTTYSRFSNGIFGGPGSGESQSITFGLSNVLEMKMLKKEKKEEEVNTREAIEDTSNVKKDPFTRFAVIDNFGVSSAYNFAAESLHISPFAFALRTALFNNKFNLQANATLNPYDHDSIGRPVDKLLWEQGSIGRWTNASVTLGTSLRPQRRVGNLKENPEVTPAEYAHIAFYRGLYVDFTIPWNLTVSYNLNYTNNGVDENVMQTLNFNGDVNLTPKWKLQMTSGWDFVKQDFSYTSIGIYRDLHCWEASVKWVPFGQRQSYLFTINVKSAALRDLKLTKRNDWQDRFASPGN